MPSTTAEPEPPPPSSDLAPITTQDYVDRYRAEGERLRVGYISADFGRHATSFLVAEVFEQGFDVPRLPQSQATLPCGDC